MNKQHMIWEWPEHLVEPTAAKKKWISMSQFVMSVTSISSNSRSNFLPAECDPSWKHHILPTESHELPITVVGQNETAL